MEESGASRAQQQIGQIRFPGATGTTPAPTAVNNYGTALASVSVNVMGGGRPSAIFWQGMAATTSNFVYEGASIAQEHVERDAVVKVLQLYHVGGMQTTGGSTERGCLSPCLPVLQLT